MESFSCHSPNAIGWQRAICWQSQKNEMVCYRGHLGAVEMYPQTFYQEKNRLINVGEIQVQPSSQSAAFRPYLHSSIKQGSSLPTPQLSPSPHPSSLSRWYHQNCSGLRPVPFIRIPHWQTLAEFGKATINLVLRLIDLNVPATLSCGLRLPGTHQSDVRRVSVAHLIPVHEDRSSASSTMSTPEQQC